MKVLITAVLCFFAVSAVARGLDNVAVRRSLVVDILRIASSARILPMLMVPVYDQDKLQVKHHVDALMVEMNGVLRERTDLLHDYMELQYNREVDLDSLVTELYEEMARVTSLYVAKQKTTKLGSFKWKWGGDGLAGVVKFDDEARKNILRQALKVSVQAQRKLCSRESEGMCMIDIYDLLQGRMDKHERQSIDDLRVFYTEFPQLNIPMRANEVALVREMAVDKKLSFSRIMDKLELEMLQSITENDDIELQQNVHLVDIIKSSKLIEMIENYYNIDGKSYVNDPDTAVHLVKINVANLRESVALHSLNMQKEWQVTWSQLRESRVLIDVLGEFIQTIGLDWPTFGQLIYPQDERAAAQFITNIIMGESVNTEAITTALQTYRETLQDDELVGHIDNFVADLPHLVEKNLLLSDIAQLLDDNLLTENNHPHAGLDGESPRAILMRAIEHAVNATGRWKYLGARQIMRYSEWYIPASLVVSHLARAGLTETQLREYVFTSSGFNKLQRGKAFNTEEIEAVRQLVSAEKIEALLSSYESEDKQVIAQRAQFLPLILQLESFVYILAKRLNSDGEFLQALQELVSNKSAEGEGIFAPLALTLQDLPKPTIMQNKNTKRKKRSTKPSQIRQIRRALVKVAGEMESERKKYFAATDEEPQQNKTTVLPHQDEQREKHRQIQAQLQAKRRAQREFEQQVLSLARKMNRELLPLGTPLWLRLQVIMAYMEVDGKELGQRAAMKSVDEERFAALIVQDAAVIATEAELESIKQALTQHTLGREKRGMISSREKNMLLENMDKEIVIMSSLVSVFDTWRE